MAYRLGLDVGTASIGLAAYELDETGIPTAVSYHAVRIFKEPLLPAKQGGVGKPKKAARRLARQSRRQHQRRCRRMRRIARHAPLLGRDPEHLPSVPGNDILELRARAANERIEPPDLLRVFLHMAKHRGYAGGFRVQGEDENTGVVATGIDRLRAAMQTAGTNTLGEYLLHRYRHGETTRLKRAGLYAQRALVEDELVQIWQT
jgi:CRISPR-associated endonuclease Csn1